mmetsp:Transcript_18685/g.35052  ORF Transcript_18685/g.35052 Transcript_18685/m.35052 type:complete len:362 (-) Transcript_18685:65-1150(-)
MKCIGLLLNVLGAATASKYAQSKFMAPNTLMMASPTHEAFMALLSEKGRPLDPMVSSLAAMAESIAKQEPATRSESVNSIKTLVNGLLDNIISQHRIAQKSVTNQSAFDMCNVNKATEMAHAATVRKEFNWTNTTDQYLACRSEFEVLNQTYTSCISQEEMLRVAAAARCEYFQAVDRSDTFQSWFCHEDDFPASSSYEAYLQRNIDMLADFRMRRTNCTNATSSHTAKQLECAGARGQASTKEVGCATLTPTDKPADCSSYQAKKQACTSYHNCWVQAHDETASAASTANQLADSLKAQWRALKKIECLLEVILTSTDTSGKLDACIAETHDTSVLDIAVPAEPTAEGCDYGTPPAGCTA